MELRPKHTSFTTPNETGSEVLQLSFALPVLILAFGIAVQGLSWVTSALAFSNALEHVAQTADIQKLNNSTTSNDTYSLASNMVADAMINTSAESIGIDDITIDTQTKLDAGNIDKRQNDTYHNWSKSSNWATVTITGRYKLPSIITINDGFTIERSVTTQRRTDETVEVS